MNQSLLCWADGCLSIFQNLWEGTRNMAQSKIQVVVSRNLTAYRNMLIEWLTRNELCHSSEVTGPKIRVTSGAQFPRTVTLPFPFPCPLMVGGWSSTFAFRWLRDVSPTCASVTTWPFPVCHVADSSLYVSTSHTLLGVALMDLKPTKSLYSHCVTKPDTGVQNFTDVWENTTQTCNKE